MYDFPMCSINTSIKHSTKLVYRHATPYNPALHGFVFLDSTIVFLIRLAHIAHMTEQIRNTMIHYGKE